MIILTNFNLLVTFSNLKKLKLMALKMLKEFFKILNSAKQVIIFRHAILGVDTYHNKAFYNLDLGNIINLIPQ
ncbi:hypothetical protein HpHA223_07440 [Helicobacter pylori]